MRAAAVLLEREREFEALGSAVRAAAAGAGGVIVLSGPAGIGKTALLDALERGAERDGTRLLRASGDELERAFAYGLARQLFEPVLASESDAAREQLLSGAAAHAAAIVDPRSATVGASAADPSVVPHGLYWLTANLAAVGPLLLVLDDAHWSDVASLQWLIYLARRIEELPVCVLVATRPAEPDSPTELLDVLAAQESTRVVSPAPLTETGVAALARTALGGAVEGEFVRACWEATDGNPFYVTQLLRALQAEGASAASADATRVGRLGPQVVASTMLARLATMAPDARAVAQAAAVLTPQAELRYAAELAEVPPPAAARAADALHQVGLLDSVDPCRFAHPLLRAALESDLRPAQRGLLHQRAAAMLARSEAPVEAVAAHLLLSPPSNDPWAVSILWRAADEATARGAATSAIAYLRRALAEPVPSEDRAELLIVLGSAETAARAPEAVGHLEHAASLARDSDQGCRASIALAEAHVFSGDLHAGYEVALAAAERFAEPGTDGRRLELEALLLRVATVGGFIPQTAARVRAISPELTPDSRAASIILGVAAFHAAVGAEPSHRVRALAERALPDGRLPDLTPGTQFGLDVSAVVIVWLGDYDRAEQLYTEAIRGARVAGSRLGVAAFAAARSVGRVRSGNLVGAEADVEEVLMIEPDASAAPFVLVARWTQASLLIERGDPVAAEALGPVAPSSELGRRPLEMLIRHTAAVAQLAQGRFADAAAMLEQVGQFFSSIATISPGVIPWRSDLALALAGLGQRERAYELATAELELAEQAEHDRARGVALRALGTIEPGAAGLAHLERAVATLAPTLSRLEYARALIDHGAALRRANRRRDAREQLRAGVDIAHRITAHALAERGQVELRALGARPRTLALSGVDSLTASEARVARMAADGLANREIAAMLFVSLKTVEKHLGSAFSKLNIRSRRDLAAALGEGES